MGDKAGIPSSLYYYIPTQPKNSLDLRIEDYTERGRICGAFVCVTWAKVYFYASGSWIYVVEVPPDFSIKKSVEVDFLFSLSESHAGKLVNFKPEFSSISSHFARSEFVSF